MASKRRVFISFDYENDSDLKTLLVGQAKNPDFPLKSAKWSVKEPLTRERRRPTKRSDAWTYSALFAASSRIPLRECLPN